MKAVILARVSSKEQEEGHSLDAQINRLRKYCIKKNLPILKEFILTESSTRGDRPEFHKMIKYIEQQKTKIALVCDKVDRLQRSFSDVPLLEKLRVSGKLELHFKMECQILDQNANSSQLLTYHLFTLMANNQTNNISDNVNRSFQHKIKNGEWLSLAPLGYLNVRDKLTGKSNLIIDNEKAFLIKRLFEEYATGAYSINEVRDRATQIGLVTRKGKPVSNSQIHNLIKNPFYCGTMIIKENKYPHNYETIISKHLFDKCQDIRLDRSNKIKNTPRQTKKDFVFRGLLNCFISQKKVTTDQKKGKYNYLICRNPENADKKIWIKEGIVLEQLINIFNDMKIPVNILEFIQERLESSQKAENRFHKDAIKRLENENIRIEKQKEILLDVLLDKSITQDIYTKKQKELSNRQVSINEELAIHLKNDDSFQISVSILLSLLSRISEIFKSSKNGQKRELMAFVFSNLSLRGQKLEYTLNKPFDMMVNCDTHSEWLWKKIY